MRKTHYRKSLVFGAVLVFLLVLLLIKWPDSDDSAYFRRASQSQGLLADEQKQWQYVQSLYRKMDATGDFFKDWDPEQQDWWKYAIAFLAYGMPSLSMSDPAQHESSVYFFSVMIDKMKAEKVWKDWQDYGFGEDPICRHNIMYKGHLNLMYGLYQMMSGDQRYAKEYTWLTQSLVTEIRENFGKKYQGVVCEPNQYFAQCNAIGLLSLHIYDKIYGTDYTNNEVAKVMGFINSKMKDPITGLYWESYHPSHDVTVQQLSGYTNAWTLTMLRVFDPEAFNTLYPQWKKTFVRELGPLAYVKENPDGGPSRIATLFGLLAAKEFEDVSLFNKLRFTADTLGGLHQDGETGAMRYRFADNTLLNGMSLSFKLHMGWGNILQHKWPVVPVQKSPEVKDLSWKDILSKKAG